MLIKGFSLTSPPTLGPIFQTAQSRLRLCDIGPNIKDEKFYGRYHKKYHEPDINQVIERAQSLGVCSMICTGSSLKISEDTLTFCNTYGPDSSIFCTAGVHPLSSKVFDEKGVEPTMDKLTKIIEDGLRAKKLVAIGECGLDYHRLERCNARTQRIGFERQLELATNYELPLFLHSRDAADDFLALLGKYKDRLRGGGVVHCFTGSDIELQALIEMGFYIGLTGASLRTEQGLLNAVTVPDHLLLLETDSPWCGIKANHPSFKYVDTHFPMRDKEKFEEGVMVKGRNEPCTMVQVLEVVAKLRGRDPLDLAEQVYANTERLFPLMKTITN